MFKSFRSNKTWEPYEQVSEMNLVSILNSKRSWSADFSRGKLLNFLQYGTNQAAVSLKSRTDEGLTQLCARIQLSSKNIWMPPFLGLWELQSCVLMSWVFSFVKKLYFRCTALSRAVVNLSVISVGWSEVKVSSSLNQGLAQMTSWGVFQPMLHCDYPARQGTCSRAAAQSNHTASVQRSFEGGGGQGVKVLYWKVCSHWQQLLPWAALLNKQSRNISCLECMNLWVQALYEFGSCQMTSSGPCSCRYYFTRAVVICFFWNCSMSKGEKNFWHFSLLLENRHRPSWWKMKLFGLGAWLELGPGSKLWVEKSWQFFC